MPLPTSTDANVSGDLLWAQPVLGKDGSNFILCGEIRCYADGTVGTGIIPTRLEFYTANASGVLTKAATLDKSQAFIPAGAITRASRQIHIPVCGNAKVGATAGWVITGGTNIGHATLPAAQTGSTLIVPISGLCVGDVVTAIAACGQVESAGNTVTMTLELRKLTNAAADNTDATLGNDTLGAGVTADTILSASNLGFTLGTAETLAADESLYALITGTTAAATDIDLTHLIVTVTQN